ncbi:hypothetical protein HAZT_HAZT006617 [Hyalella azteca]|uniref:Uncharacterized protein n=1 Tax=Hyalella azteca TaxID=294128 RepID=A0A6A0GX92_HYAAZ|nr:hypothetical protein HAZT_HAZT006617 [Hyalella azteca]
MLQSCVPVLTLSFPPIVLFIRPQGSEAQMPMSASDVKSTNPDHVGGYKVAVPMFRGIESKFGLFLPRFQAASPAPST